jgi:hypothetical protein
MKINSRYFNTIAASSFLTATIAHAQTRIPNPLGEGTGISTVIVRITDFIFNLGISLAAVIFLVGGLQYIFSFGSEDKVKDAKNTLFYGAVGLVILLVAKSITALIKDIIA